jgi:urocanate hydratase
VKLSTDTAAIASQYYSIQLEAHACYRVLFPARSDKTSEPSLGGNLLYAGELDSTGRAVTVAGNAAGCATLAVTADGAAQKQAIRESVVDFVVTSLDEALRILKNEIRKRNSVGVCIGSDPDQVEREMIERGVLPDLVFAGTFDQRREVRCFGKHVREVMTSKPDPSIAVFAWQVVQAPARWMPKLDAIALDCLADDPWTRRWIRLSPLYFGRASLAERAFYCEPQIATEVMRRIEDSAKSGVIEAEVLVSLTTEGESKVLRLNPREV